MNMKGAYEDSKEPGLFKKSLLDESRTGIDLVFLGSRLASLLL